jgi:hypothetical protein
MQAQYCRIYVKLRLSGHTDYWELSNSSANNAVAIKNFKIWQIT